ncbi:Retrovirus-related Pol polyprotein from transposon [Ceratobasidium sp. AG-Ba]|nr:Retrovirus-related Pol polyprotein from transposon [Ceratobasidium sp. AG-Ba]
MKRDARVKQPPSAVNARSCVHCQGDHWDNECKNARKNQNFVRANLAATDEEGLAAQEEYENLYAELSSEESTTEESETEQEESESESSEEDFNSPSDVLSATASSEQPVTETEESQDVSEGYIDGQVNSGLATASCKIFQAPVMVTRLPSRRGWAKQYKLERNRVLKTKAYTAIGNRLVLRRVMSRPPGTAWMGTTSTLVQGQLGDHCELFNITFDSGSDITLISEEKYKSLNNPPPKKKGQSIQVIQVTDKCVINEFVTVPVVFNTPQGQVEMLVEAYVVKNMTTPFILGNDFGNQYLLSLVRNKEGSFIELGISGRRIPIIRSDSDPRTDDAGHVYSVTSHKIITSYVRDKPKKHKPKSYSATPKGTVPVRIYDTKTLPPKTLSLIRVKASFEPGEEFGFVEKAMHSNRSHEDLYGLSNCIINANNPKLQIANFGNTPIRIQAGQIIGYMHPISALNREGELSVEQKKQGEAIVQLVNTLEQLDPIKEEPIDPEYSKSPEGGPKIWDNPGPDIIPSADAFKEIEFGPNLTKDERKRLQQIIKKNITAFSFDGRLGNYPAKIRVRLKDENTRPVSLAPYPVSPEKKQVIGKQIDEWLRLGVISPSKSPWGAPVIVVYRNGKPRVCIDYRRLNNLTIPNVYPLPLQKDILDNLSGSIYFTTLDALAGFNQLSIHEDDKHKTAFTCWKGHYEAEKLLFGQRNGPAEFQEVMDQVLAEFKYICALVYIDDIVIYSKTFDEHCIHLDKVLGAIANSGITLSPKKCKIGFDSLILLGQRVSRLGLSTHKEKVDAILGMAPPKNVPQLHTIIGAIVYFGHMIARMAETCAPLFRLLRKGVPWQWGELEQKAWDLVKRALTSAPVLAYPDTDKPFRLYTDASDVGLSGVLQQIQLIKIKDLAGTRTFERLEKAYKAKEPIPKLCTPVPSDEHVVAGGIRNGILQIGLKLKSQSNEYAHFGQEFCEKRNATIQLQNVKA